MFKESLKSYDLNKHNEVELVLDSVKLKPSWVDFDFTITMVANSAPSAEITVYNLSLDKLKAIKVYCNEVLLFIATQEDMNNPHVTLEIITNEISIASKINCSSNNFKLPQILLKGSKFTYKNANTKINEKTITLSRDYIFKSGDSEEAKITKILENENKFKNAFFINGKELYLLEKLNTKLDNKPTNFFIINELRGYDTEEITLTMLFSYILKPLQSIRYKPIGEMKEYTYIVISVVNSFTHNRGLLQTVLLKRGKRLELFLN